MRIIYNITGFLLAASLMAGCVRKNDVLPPVKLPPGGKGGKAKLVVTAQHHKTNLNTAMVYIKYASTVMPDVNTFDDSAAVTFELGRPAATFKDLTQGDYYLYAKGTDFELEPGKDQVMGGATFRVIDTLEKTYDLYLQTDNYIHHD